MKEFYTKSELEAYGLLLASGTYPLTSNMYNTPHDAGNKIIRLAEQIKAERAVAGMKGREI